MKKESDKRKVSRAAAKAGDLSPLLAEVRRIIQSSRRGAASVINTFKLMRKFYLLFSSRIGQTASDQLTPPEKSMKPFTLSWSHYVLLLTIKDPDERRLFLSPSH